MKNFLREAFRFLGYRVTRDRPAHRFEAMDEALRLMAGAGFRPRLVIDSGANRGQFYRLARPVFPDAVFHLIEPQPACRADLEAIERQEPERVRLHACALTEPGVADLRLLGGGPGGGSTGAWAVSAEERAGEGILVPATTLDRLFAEALSEDDRALLKLDLEAHELPALKGAEALLGRVEAVLTEVSFYDVNREGIPIIADIVTFLSARGFDLYDVASLSSRPRDGRLRLGDLVFVRRRTPLLADLSWE